MLEKYAPDSSPKAISVILSRLRDYYHPDAIGNQGREDSNQRWEDFNQFTLTLLSLWTQSEQG